MGVVAEFAQVVRLEKTVGSKRHLHSKIKKNIFTKYLFQFRGKHPLIFCGEIFQIFHYFLTDQKQAKH